MNLCLRTLLIRCQSYILRWVYAKSNSTISWTVQPHKRSINVGLFKHPGALASLPTVAGLPALSAVSSRGTDDERSSDQPEVVERLENIGLKQVVKLGKCDADKFTKCRHDVQSGEGGHYAIVFDNTFSKSTGKMVTFFLMTYPTSAQNQISFGAQIHHSQAMASAMSLAPPIAKKSPKLVPRDKPSAETLDVHSPVPIPAVTTPKPREEDAHFYTGVLQKRRRKKHQGYARRFFSLDYNSSTLSYYHDRNSSALRGAIPLSLAAIGANAKTREISIDSGAEIWHLRAGSPAEFDGWKRALEKATQMMIENTPQPEDDASTVRDLSLSTNNLNWERLEALLSKMSGTRDAVRRLCNDTASAGPGGLQSPFLDGATPTERDGDSYFPEEKRAFWKRKTSNADSGRNIFKRNVSSQLIPPGAHSPQPPHSPLPPSSPLPHSLGMHDNMRQILNNLDTLIADFSSLVGEAKRRNSSVPQSAISRMSIDSQEYFDAEDRRLTRSDTQILEIEDGSDSEEKAGDSDTSSDVEEVGGRRRSGSISSLMPPPSKSLQPLPLAPIKRRDNVQAPTVMPPSLISFLRKNVGKDLSTISMPVSANEPTSLLQKCAENLEYSELLDKARASPDPADRLLLVTAFALSSLSNARVKDRSTRKPFNPMLGETFELVREDKNFRFVSEKVSHRPVQLAFHGEGNGWSLAQSPMPSQKFWGKSSEIITEGKVRLILQETAGGTENYSWLPCNAFLRNIIAGEKYIEPVGTMTVVNETTGWKTITTFKAKGMWSGRSEELDVQMLDASNVEHSLGLTGTWTSNLVVKEDGKPNTKREVWHAGPLVDRAEKHYGMTKFAAELNEITDIERSKLPPTDSRLRSDQRALENGKYDEAEKLKNEIEEGQRRRRKEMETAGEEWTPKFFVKVNRDNGEVSWKLKAAEGGYWERRAKGDWTGVVDVLDPEG